MVKKRETIFAEKFDTRLKDVFGEEIFIENIQQETKHGTADRFICLNGRFIAVELKLDETGVISSIQAVKLRKVIKSGGIAAVVYPSTFEAFIKRLIKISTYES